MVVRKSSLDPTVCLDCSMWRLLFHFALEFFKHGLFLSLSTNSPWNKTKDLICAITTWANNSWWGSTWKQTMFIVFCIHIKANVWVISHSPGTLASIAPYTHTALHHSKKRLFEETNSCGNCSKQTNCHFKIWLDLATEASYQSCWTFWMEQGSQTFLVGTLWEHRNSYLV